MENRLPSNEIKSLLDQNVKINLGGPESRIGVLLSAEDEHLVLQGNTGEVIYYQRSHVKSVVKKAKEIKLNPYFCAQPYFDATTFQDILSGLKYKWVKINRGGPESIDGILSDVNEEYVTLVNREEVIYVLNFHIKSVSQVVKDKKNEEE
ncbi:spore coat protein [Bacillus sp. NPDC094077]|uniref:spore coat protein n=1 Tax=Bacillus sp. NPDC094077 TaxID=3390932 RepID=UPI003CFE2034